MAKAIWQWLSNGDGFGVLLGLVITSLAIVARVAVWYSSWKKRFGAGW